MYKKSASHNSSPNFFFARSRSNILGCTSYLIFLHLLEAQIVKKNLCNRRIKISISALVLVTVWCCFVSNIIDMHHHHYITICDTRHCVKRVRIRILSVLYLSVFSPNAGKYGPEKIRIRVLFTQCVSLKNTWSLKLLFQNFHEALSCWFNVNISFLFVCFFLIARFTNPLFPFFILRKCVVSLVDEPL